MAVTGAIDPPLDERDAVLFDMDGTLLFLPVDMDALRERLEGFHRRHGLEITFRPLTDDLETAARELERRLGPAEARAARRWAAAQVDRAEVEAAEDARPRAGVLAALRELRARGVRVGVVSNNTRRGIVAALDRVGVDPDDLSALVSRQDATRPKPDPEMVELAVRRLVDGGWRPAADAGGARAGRLVYVGDAPSDVMAVRRARLDHLAPTLRGVTVVIVGGGRAGTGLLAGPDVDLLAADDAQAFHLLTGC